MLLVPATGSFVARFLDIPPRPDQLDPASVYVDVTSPPVLDSEGVCAVDMDLDVIRFRSGAVVLDDADEFEAHIDAMGYPPPVVKACRDTAHQLMAELTSCIEPFGTASADWLALVR